MVTFEGMLQQHIKHSLLFIGKRYRMEAVVKYGGSRS
jgi:hypothetical protein